MKKTGFISSVFLILGTLFFSNLEAKAFSPDQSGVSGCNLALSYQTVDETCNADNGAINLSVSGANGALTYVWTYPSGSQVLTQNLSNISAGMYNVQVTDALGCSQSLNVQVNEVLDQTAPQLATYDNVEVPLSSNGTYTVTPNDLIKNVSDDCDFTLSIDKPRITCRNVTTPKTMVVTATDNSGNSTSASVVVKAVDITGPKVNFYKPAIVQLDENGEAKVYQSSIDSLSRDNCSPVFMTLSKTEFDCNDIGTQTLTVTAEDQYGNDPNDFYTKQIVGNDVVYVKTEMTWSTTVDVFIDDCLPPVAQCKDTTLYLGSSGIVSVSPHQLDDGSFDNCELWQFALPDSVFDCTEAGVNQVNLYAYDRSGNMACCPVSITVKDTIKPVAVCQDITVYLDPDGQVVVKGAQLDGGTQANCDVDTFILSDTVFSCNSLGENMVEMTAIDNNGVESKCSAIVNVVDTIAPNVICTPTTITIGADGFATLNAEDLDAGSTDNCGIQSYSVDKELFYCDEVGTQQVVLTVIDNSGNSATCTTTVTIEGNSNLTCCNITDEGEIEGDQEYCGPTDASIIGDAVSASGGTGALEYAWYKSTDYDPITGLGTWTLIAGESSATYDPGLVSETTYFTRKAKRGACDIYPFQINSDPVCGSNEAEGCIPEVCVEWGIDCQGVRVTSSKDLSNVVLQFTDGSEYKFDNLNVGDTYTFSGVGSDSGKVITGVWVKSGCNSSNDGAGYGEFIQSNCSPEFKSNVVEIIINEGPEISGLVSNVSCVDGSNTSGCATTYEFERFSNATVGQAEFNNLYFSAEGRSGNNAMNGTFEADIHNVSPYSILSSKNFVWPNGTAVPLSIKYDPTATGTSKFIYMLGAPGNQVVMNIDPVAQGYPTDINGFYLYMRTAANTSLNISNLAIDGIPSNTNFGHTNPSTSQLENVVFQGDELANGFEITAQVTFSWSGSIPQNSNMNFNFKLGNITCDGNTNGSACDGEVDLTVTGGEAPFSYNWSNGETTQDIFELCGDDYTVTVTDNNGCEASSTYTVTEPTPITTTTTNTSVTSGGNVVETYDVKRYNTNSHAVWLPNLANSVSDKFWFENGNGTFTMYPNGTAHLTGEIYNANDANKRFDVSIWFKAKNDWNLWSAQGRDWKGNAGTVGTNYENWNFYEMDDSKNNVLEGLSDYAGNTLYLTHKPANYNYAFQIGVAANDKDGDFGMSGWFNYSGSWSGHGDFNFDAFNNSTSKLCDATATISASGGTAPYTYTWSNGAEDANVTDLCAGTHTVTVMDANGCPVTDTITIPEIDPLSLTINASDPTCASGTDGEVSVNVSGGTSPYTYLWSTGATTASVNNLSSGSYSVLVTDANGIQKIASVDISRPICCNVVDGGSISGNQENCGPFNPNAITGQAPASGGIGSIEYIWMKSAVNVPNIVGNPHWEVIPGSTAPSYDPGTVSETTYFIRCARTVGCDLYIGESNVVAITINEFPEASVTKAEDVSCFGESDGEIDLAVTKGAAPYSFSWNNGASTQGITNVAAGTYSATITDANGCSTSISATIGQPTELSGTISANDPTCNTGVDGDASVNVSGGTTPYSYLWSTGATSASISGLGNGTYSVKVTDANGCNITESVSIARPECCNVNNGGNIAGNQENCGPFDPSEITSTSLPSGGLGNIEYLWLKSNVNSPNVVGNSDWEAIPNSNSSTYDPGFLSETTYFIRCSRSEGCDFYAGESNVIEIKILDKPEVSIAQIAEISCNGEADAQLQGSISGGTAPLSYEWTYNNQVLQGPSSITTTISNAEDDAEEKTNNNSVLLNSSTLEMGNDDADLSGYDQRVGLRFRNIQIPQGATITNAYVKFRSQGQYTYNTSLSIKAHNTGDAPQFSSSNSDLTNRVATNTVVSWSPNSWTNNVQYQTPDISLVIEEIVTRNDWSQGNDLAILIDGSGYRSAHSYDSDPNKAPQLVVEYEQQVNGLTVNNADVGTYELTVQDANNCTNSATITVTEPEELEGEITKVDVSCSGVVVDSCSVSAFSQSGHAVWLPNYPGSSSDHYFFIENSGTLKQYGNGTAHLSGTVANDQNPNQKWEIDVWFKSKRDWAEWSGLNRGWKGNASIVQGNYADWSYYEMDASYSNKLIGQGDFAGQTINLSHKPSSLYYGFQVGLAANDKNANEGASGWFNYTGASSGHGDFNFNLTCGESTECGCENGVKSVLVTYNGQDDNVTIEAKDDNGNIIETFNNVDAGDQLTVSGANLTNGILDAKTKLCVITTTGGANNQVCGSNTASGCTPAVCATWSSDCKSVTTTSTKDLSNVVLEFADGTEYKFDGLSVGKSHTFTGIGSNAGKTIVGVWIKSGCNSSGDGPGYGEYIASNCGGSTTSSCETLDTDCSTDLVGATYGDFTINSYTDGNGNSCDGSETSSSEEETTVTVDNCDCEGRMTNFTVRYTGSNGGDVTIVTGSQQSSGVSAQGFSNLQSGDEITISGDWKGGGRLGPKTFLTIDGVSYEIHTSCSVNILGDTYGPFEVIAYTDGAGNSCNGNNNNGGGSNNGSGNSYTDCSLNVSGLSHGEIIASQFVNDGISISSSSNRSQYSDDLVVFNSNLSNTADPDLELDLGNVFIFSENIADNNNDGLVDNPDDTRFGGTITFTFDQPRRVESFKYLDRDDGTTAWAKAYTEAGTLITTATITQTGDATVQTVNVNADNASSLVIYHDGSGAVGDFVFSCPETTTGEEIPCDGSATVTATGGTAPYTYAWSNGETGSTVSNLCPGTYTVIITDANGCSWTQQVSINVPTPIEIVANVSQPTCGSQNGSISTNIAGGTAPYTVEWNNGATTENLNNLGSGVYEVTVTDARGCTHTESVTLTEPNAISLSANITNVSCNGSNDGSIDLTVSGDAVSSISWNTGDNTEDINHLSAGTYVVTVNGQSGCTEIFSVEVEEPVVLTANAVSPQKSNGYNVSAKGANDGEINVSVNGGTAPYQYFWNGPSQDVTITSQIAHGDDDAEEDKSGNVDLNSTDLELVDNGKDKKREIGLRFTGIDVPQGAIIKEAYLQFTTEGTDNKNPNIYIYGEDVDNSSRFSSSKEDISDRTKTSANRQWRPSSWYVVNESGLNQRTGDVKAIIQEIVDRNGWQSGNALALILEGRGEREAHSYDGDAGKAPKLVITYEGGFAGGANPTNATAGTYNLTVVDANGCQAHTTVVLDEPSGPASMSSESSSKAEMVDAETAQSEAERAEVGSIEMSPNPATYNGTVRFQLSQSSQVEVKVFDMSGRALINVFEGFAGSNLPISVDVDLAELRSGIYNLAIISDSGKVVMKRFVIAR